MPVFETEFVYILHVWFVVNVSDDVDNGSNGGDGGGGQCAHVIHTRTLGVKWASEERRGNAQE